MGKRRPKPRPAHRNHHDASGVKKKILGRGVHGESTLSKPSKTGPGSQLVKRAVPFQPSDHILLVGEEDHLSSFSIRLTRARGTTSSLIAVLFLDLRLPDFPTGDFSFALSLVGHHKCTHVTATCYDSEQVLHQKYPQTYDILKRLLAHNEDQESYETRIPKPNGDCSPSRTDCTREVEQAQATDSSSSEQEGFSRFVPSGAVCISESHPPPANGLRVKSLINSSESRISFHPSISAESLSKYKAIRRKGAFNKIVFNFPHVGGLSTDVNRQVRANQELLVAFFKSCKPLLASQSAPAKSRELRSRRDPDSKEPYSSDSSSGHDDAEDVRATGQVIVSLFDGEPYSLWNVRDLARHSGFRVVTSWRFPWHTYPGYRHARTAGEIVRKSSRGVDAVDRSSALRAKKGASAGAWKGEDREARGFVFEMMGSEEMLGADPGKRKREKHEKKARQGSRKKRRECLSSSESSA